MKGRSRGMVMQKNDTIARKPRSWKDLPQNEHMRATGALLYSTDTLSTCDPPKKISP